MFKVSTTLHYYITTLLIFPSPPRENYFLDFKLLFRNVKTGGNCVGEELANFKSKLRHIAHSSLKFYNRKKKKLENISEEELNALNELASFDDIIIQKADKGNVIVLVDKSSYICKMEDILNDTSKFSPISFERGYDDLKYILQKERDIHTFLISLKDKGVINAEEVFKLTPTGSSPGILYGLCKVHKVTQSDCPPFRPILSAIDTPAYKLAKCLVPILAQFTSNQFACKVYFTFATEVRSQNSDLYIPSFDVDLLFTNIPLGETIEICVRKVFGKKRKFKGFTKSEFTQLLQLAVKGTLILFNEKYYIQNDGVAMGSPLGPHFANIFLCHWEEDIFSFVFF